MLGAECCVKRSATLRQIDSRRADLAASGGASASAAISGCQYTAVPPSSSAALKRVTKRRTPGRTSRTRASSVTIS